MYTNIWTWMRDFERTAIQNNDTTRLELVRGYERAWGYIRNGAYDDALAHFEQSVALAEKLQEPCWYLFLESNCCEILIYYKAAMQKALDRTIRLATRAYKPQYENCPVRSRIYCNLADVYGDVDWFGYLDDIFAMLDYIENDVIMDADTHLRVQYIRAQLNCDLEDYDAAETIVQKCLSQGFTNHFRMSHANDLMMQIAYSRGDLAEALAYAQQREHHARIPSILRSIADSLLWQAVITWYMGDKGKAQALLQRGIDEYKRFDLPRRGTYYSSLSTYHENNNEIDKALVLREQHLQEVATQSITAQSFCHLGYCRLLGRIGKPMDQALAAARAITTEMKKPDLYLERVQEIEDGRYYLHDWLKAFKGG